MSDHCQTTLAAPVSFGGKGIHSGQTCEVMILPAPAGHGVRFLRTDLPGSPEIPAHIDSLSTEPSSRQTILCAPGAASASVQTIEHVLAVLHGMGVDNARVEMSGPEPPILDGSAGEIARAVAASGIAEIRDSVARVCTIDRPVGLNPAGFPNVEYAAWPSEYLTVTYFLEYDKHPVLGSQAASFRVDPDLFAAEIAPARTFCLYEEIEPLIKAGLIKGGEISNAIVIGQQGAMNTHMLWDNEPARHKLLDLIGDLYLLGRRVRGHIVSFRGGHSSNHQLVDYLRKEFPQND